MGRQKKEFHLAGKTYSVAAQVEANVRHIAEKAELGVPLAGKHFDFMRDLFAYHSRAEDKIGEGIEQIVVRRAARNKRNREFWIKTAGSDEWIDISWKECVRATTPLQEFENACRQAVRPVTQDFASRVFAEEGRGGRLVCPITGAHFTRSQAHVDHDDPWPFKAIVAQFIRNEGLDVNVVEYDGFEHGSTRITLRDSSLADRFRAFHDSVARLRVVSATGNQVRGKSRDAAPGAGE